MIRQKISKDIWKSKYQNNEETEENYYKRIPEGLFGDLDDESLEFYNRVVGGDIVKTFENKLKNHKCSLAGRGMYAIGTDIINQTFSNCFVIPFKKDSIEAIMETAKEAALTMKSGGGVGYSISILRPKTVKIKTTGSFSSGAVHFLEILDSTCSVIKAGNNRRGAQMVALGIWHPSIFDFINAKRTGKLTNFNMSVFVSDAFMTAVLNDENWDLIFPDTTFEKYDEEWDGNINLWKSKGYPVILHETIKAKELFDLIIKSNYNYAEPGILFEDTINERNTLYWLEYIQTTNPCVTGDTLVTTDKGDITIKSLIENGIENYKALSYNLETQENEFKTITFGEMTRENAKIIEIELENGQILKLTPDHKVYTKNRGYIKACELTEEDDFILNDKE